ncbi:7804_t:CDS:2 [Funneliformis geosporum]|uniref:Ribokinase n=1 Tax=Funneliformis geosporum TaxID=1117311 RepID=A0A9W4WQ13_9GLOM|nr:7804_t:CDS:2 [Funneliformis geosporum]
MEEPKVLTFGSINIDEFFEVPHIVSSGETITSSKYSQKAGGKGANQSVALAKAGALVWHAGKIGHDGTWIKEYMKEFGVKVDHIIISEDQPTGRAFIQVSQETRDNSIVLLPGTNHMISLNEARNILNWEFGIGDWVIMQNEIGQIGGEILKLCKEKGLTIVLNPAPISENITSVFSFNLIDYLIVNKLEAFQLYKQISESNCDDKNISAHDLLTFISNEYQQIIGIIITFGSEGLYAWYRPEQRIFNLPAFKTKVLDTTGAGDTFAGYFITSIVRDLKCRKGDVSNLSIPITDVNSSMILPTAEGFLNALKEATIAAGLAVGRLGAMESIPSFNDVHRNKTIFDTELRKRNQLIT